MRGGGARGVFRSGSARFARARVSCVGSQRRSTSRRRVWMRARRGEGCGAAAGWCACLKSGLSVVQRFKAAVLRVLRRACRFRPIGDHPTTSTKLNFYYTPRAGRYNSRGTTRGRRRNRRRRAPKRDGGKGNSNRRRRLSQRLPHATRATGVAHSPPFGASVRFCCSASGTWPGASAKV